MINSIKTLKVITADLNIDAVLVCTPRFENITTDLEREVYIVGVQDFYLDGDVKMPLTQRTMELDISGVMAETGTLKEKITKKLVDKLNTELPYGSLAGDWALI